MSVGPVQQTAIVMQPTGGQSKVISSLEGHRTWTNDILDCCNSETSCILNCLFPCIAMFEISVRLQESPCVPFCVPGGVINMRTRIRTLGGISGSICSDCMVTSCCLPCALGQMERELKTMGW